MPGKDRKGLDHSADINTYIRQHESENIVAGYTKLRGSLNGIMTLLAHFCSPPFNLSQGIFP